MFLKLLHKNVQHHIYQCHYGSLKSRRVTQRCYDGHRCFIYCIIVDVFQKNDLLQLLDILKFTERGHAFVGTK